MKALVAIAATLGLTACGIPSDGDLKDACLGIAKSAERYQSSVSPIGGEIATKPLTRDEFANMLAGGVLTPITFDRLASRAQSAPATSVENLVNYPSGNGFEQASFLKAFVEAAESAESLGLATVSVEYDVDNGNGVPERKKAQCEFPLSNVDRVQPLLSASNLARIERLKRQKYGVRDYPNRAAGCCTPRFALVDSSVHPVSGGVIMGAEIDAAVDSAMQQLRGKR